MSEAWPEDLRALVREVLRDALPGPVPPPAEEASAAPVDGEEVAIDDDADLAAFVDRLVRLLDDPEHRRDLRSGTFRFRLAARRPDEGAAPAAVPAGQAPVVRIEHGAVTERRIREAARSGASIVLGRSAVLTPLARDRARAMGVTVEKERR